MAIDSLRQRRPVREVVVLRHLAGLSPGEIAHRNGRTEASIHGVHPRARVVAVKPPAPLDCC